jgi:hypothetical protein
VSPRLAGEEWASRSAPGAKGVRLAPSRKKPGFDMGAFGIPDHLRVSNAALSARLGSHVVGIAVPPPSRSYRLAQIAR